VPAESVRADDDLPDVIEADHLTEEEAKQIGGFIDDSMSANTKKAYRIDVRQWCEWCGSNGHRAVPADPKIVAAWTAHLASKGLKQATIKRKLTALASAHSIAGYELRVNSATIRRVLRGARRRSGAKKDKKVPLMLEGLARCIRGLPSTLRGYKRRAMLALGWFSSVRSAELVAVRVEHLVFDDEGLALYVPRSKTDQEGKGRTIYMPRLEEANDVCPVLNVARWIVGSRIDTGMLFRRIYKKTGRMHESPDRELNPDYVRTVVQEAVESIGLPWLKYGSHSLRAGFVTQAAEWGVSETAIARQTGHKSMSVLKGYIRPQDPYGELNPVIQMRGGMRKGRG